MISQDQSAKFSHFVVYSFFYYSQNGYCVTSFIFSGFFLLFLCLSVSNWDQYPTHVKTKIQRESLKKTMGNRCVC